MSGTSSSIRTKFWWNSHWMVLLLNCVRQSCSPTKMATTVQLRCYWKQLWSRWAITGSREFFFFFFLWFSFLKPYIEPCSKRFSSAASQSLYRSYYSELVASFHKRTREWQFVNNSMMSVACKCVIYTSYLSKKII